MLDGAVAKAWVSRKAPSRSSVVDRLGRGRAVGPHLVAVASATYAMAVLAALVLGLSLIVSYIKARVARLRLQVGIA